MLTWFSSKKNIIRTTLLEGMTDVHAHLSFLMWTVDRSR